MDAELLELMPHSFTVEAQASVGFKPGGTTYAAGTQVAGYWNREGTEVENTEGTTVRSSSTAYLTGDPGVDTNSRITLPDGSAPPILKVAQFDDETGTPWVTVVHFG